MIRPLKSIAQIKQIDAKWKPSNFDKDATALVALAENRGRSLTYSHLMTTGMGDPDNPRPISVGCVPRLMESLSVLYRVPAVRLLKDGNGNLLSDDDVRARAYSEMCRRALLDSVWGLVDARRNLVRQCFLSFVESPRGVQARVHWPFEVYRSVTPTAADDIDQDEAIAIEVMHGPTEQESLYQLWSHEDDGSWTCHLVDGHGRMLADQPYGEDGRPPFDGLPMVLVPDTIMAGVSCLPLPESRLDFALNLNALVNDLAYIVKNQAHSLKVIETDDSGGVKAPPTSTGPDQVMILPTGSRMNVLQQNPAIGAINETVAAQLSMLALSESLPPDAFSSSRTIHTGAALKVAERDLEARRQRQVPITVEAERRAFEKMRSVHNAYAASMGMPRLDDDLQLVVSFGTSWQPTDARELQEAAFKDLAVGAQSIIGYLGERYRLDRQGAIDLYRQIQADRAQYPIGSNPVAMVEGQLPALGEGSATPDTGQEVPGAFNPDIASSVESASVVGAVQRTLGEVEPDPVETPSESTQAKPTADVQATALNGAQVTSAVGIVQAVASRQLPRDSGLAMLERFFSLKREDAEAIMGSVGSTFFIEASSKPGTPVAPTPEE